MNTLSVSIEKYHRLIIFSLLFVIAFFALSCTFNGIIPICHYVFGCDHAMHLTG